MSSIDIATIEALPESTRRSRDKSSTMRRRNQIHLIVGPRPGQALFCGSRPVPRAQRSLM